ncbi:MAG: D-alanine--D-alanine ligase family protein, partial [Acidimicrobiales bacterium]
MAPVGVIFGGPSPEHDVSVLTGLQAARALARASTEVRALYWSKAAEWFEVRPDAEASAFLEGVPAGASPLRLECVPGGGFVQRGGRMSRERPVDLDVALVCCHGGPGEDGALQSALDLAGVRHAGPTAAGAALGMDKLA